MKPKQDPPFHDFKKELIELCRFRENVHLDVLIDYEKERIA